MQLKLRHVCFPKVRLIYKSEVLVLMYSASGTAILMNKICAQFEFCAQIKLPVGGSLDIKEERLET